MTFSYSAKEKKLTTIFSLIILSSNQRKLVCSFDHLGRDGDGGAAEVGKRGRQEEAALQGDTCRRHLSSLLSLPSLRLCY